jgi:hypothetical protein
MSASPSAPDLPPDDESRDDPCEFGDADPSEEAASDPEQARRDAEEALSEIEALADLDDEPDIEGDEASEEKYSGGGETVGAHVPSGGDAGSAPEAGTPVDRCENCGALLHGPYCSQCGQEAADRIVPVWHMINEVLEAVFELDLRVLHTLPKFLFLPGRLTKEYINGRRERYIRPFRLCLFATFLLFTVLAFTTTGGFGLLFPPSGPGAAPDTSEIATAPVPGGGGQSETSPDTIDGDTNLGLKEWLFGSQKQRATIADTVRRELNSEPADNQIEQLLYRNIPKVVEDPWGFLETVIDQGPYLMFFVLPVFAVLLKLLYVRRGRLYAEHMIFSLHVHAFAFFAFATGILLEQSDVTWVRAAGPWVEASPLLYIVLAMAHVYDQGLTKSSIKAFILLFIYSIVVTIGLVFLLLLAVLLL